MSRSVNHRRRRRRLAWLVQSGRCFYCDCELKTTAFTMDHVVPRDCGGGSVLTNLVASCYRCNHEKGNGPASSESLAKLHERNELLAALKAAGY
jgi:5-methylcytosine-specific restriction endonuclease McrA